MAPFLIPLLAASRIASGIGGICVPRLAAKMLSLPHGPSSVVLTHLVGGRELALGTLLYTAWKDKTAEGARFRELRRALLAIIAVDATEVVTNLTSYAAGELSAAGLGVMGGVTMVTLGLELFSVVCLVEP
ncbi:hypothetical protein FE257_008353 [Aspergillus nanangensis]|uniref:Uncharacterized protein n=1 Tax=Aspergillus nanangensis TaxID=2582783 RepID=A0AAD4GTK0_ASPNN|nr:hypothetical protein FE257_008353 [Aspergillus nanangensis]